MSPITELIGGARSYGWGALLTSTSFESIATATGTGSSGTITFSSIPSTYQHLQIRYLAKDTNTSATILSLDIRFNSDSGFNYARHYLYGDGSAATAAGDANQSYWSPRFALATSDASYNNIFSVGIIDIHDYASTTKNKTMRMINGFDYNVASTTSKINLQSGLWRSTNAINSITIQGSTAFTTSSTFALYGIKGA